MAYPRFQRSRDFKHLKRASTNITCNSTGWTNLDTALDLVLTAQVGDVVEVGLSSRVDNEAVELYLDAVTWVSGAAVTSIGNQIAPTSTTRGVSAWTAPPSVVSAIGGSAMLTLVSSDLSAGTVTLRLRYRTSSAANKTLNALADYPLHFWAKNLGPADPN